MNRITLWAACAVMALPAQRLDAQAPATPAPPAGRWAGAVHWRVSHEAGVGQSTRRLSGSVAVAPSKTRAGAVQVTIRLLSSDYVGAEFLWSIAKGRCFAGGEALLEPAKQPGLPINDDGIAELEADASFVMETEARYHFNLYLYGAEESHVVACAELRYGRPK